MELFNVEKIRTIFHVLQCSLHKDARMRYECKRRTRRKGAKGNEIETKAKTHTERGTHSQ